MKKFLKSLFKVAFPIALQQLFLNLASLLDTIMVGQLNESTISGVYVANQIIFVVTLMIFGSLEGASVFYCQFFGVKDKDNMTKSCVFKLYSSIIVAIIDTIIVIVFKDSLIRLFTDDAGAIAVANSYLDIVVWSLIPYAIFNSLVTTLRESHFATTSMIISIIGAGINTIINYVLIFGKLGFNALGADGAAIGTIIERFVEAIIIITICAYKKYDFTYHFFKNLKIEKVLLKAIIAKSIPLLLNELFWSLGQTALTYIYAKQYDIATVVLPIEATVSNLLFVFCLGLGSGVSIIVGNTLGNNELEEAKKQANYSLFATVFVSIFMCLSLVFSASFIVSLYTGISDSSKEIARILLIYQGIALFFAAGNTTMFFLLRAGGRTLIVFLFDSAFAWIIQMPLMLLIEYLWPNMEFTTFFLVTRCIELIKLAIGLILVYSNKWCKNITNYNHAS